MNTLRNLNITILTFLSLLCIALGLFAFSAPAKVSADNDDLRFAPYYVKESANVNKGNIIFSLSLDNSQLDSNYKNLSTGTSKGALCERTYETQARYQITVRKHPTATTTEDIVRYDILSFGKYLEFYETKIKSTSAVKIDFLTDYVKSKLTAVDKKTDDYRIAFELTGAKVWEDQVSLNSSAKRNDTFTSNVSGSSFIGRYERNDNKYGFPFEPTTDGSYMYIALKDIAYEGTYSIDVRFVQYSGAWFNIFDEIKYSTIDTANVQSTRAHVIDTLRDMRDNDTLKNQSTDFQTFANAVLTEYETQEITVRYLTQIEGTPFAKATTATISVPVIKNTVNATAVTEALGIETMVLGQKSAIQGFDYVASENLFEAVYETGTVLTARSVDGNGAEYYLDVNKSYAEYFGQLVEDGAMAEGLYSYLFNQIVTAYPNGNGGYILESQGVTKEDLHGFFGFVVIPQTSTLNAVWKDLFNKPTTFSGEIHYFETAENLSYAEYTTLLEDYDYGWLEVAWEQCIINSADGNAANFYFFYVDTLTPGEVFIGENSAEDSKDDDTAKEKDDRKFYEKIAEWLKGDNKDLGDNLSNVVASILLIGGLVAIAYIYFKKKK